MNAQNALNTTAERKADELKDYLRGYGGPTGEHLLPLIAFDGWSHAAQVVLAARCTCILNLLDDSTLALIAEGVVSVPTAAREVAAEKGAV